MAAVPQDLERIAQDSIRVESFDDAVGVEGTGTQVGVGAVAIVMMRMQGTGAGWTLSRL